jgi:lipopolysaccharide transport system permease protein
MNQWDWVREGWAYRNVYYLLAWRDTKLRYKQTVLGAIWAILQPFLTMVLFTVVFGRVIGVPTDGIPSPVFYYAALLPWMYFSSTVSQSGLSLVSNARLITKVYFPRSALPIAPALSGMVDLGIGTLILFAMMAYYGLHPTWKLLLWPILVFMLASLSCTVGMMLAALNVRYRDVKHAVPFLLQLWLFATPIVYPAKIIPEHLRPLAYFNPLTGIVSAFRSVSVPNHDIDWPSLCISTLIIMILLVVSIAYFSKAEETLSDII